jgi:hypothetical protein
MTVYARARVALICRTAPPRHPRQSRLGQGLLSLGSIITTRSFPDGGVRVAFSRCKSLG